MKMAIAIFLASTILTGQAAALDFTYPNAPQDGGLTIIGYGEVTVQSYVDRCAGTPCNWQRRYYTLNGARYPKWVAVPSGSPIYVEGAAGAYVYSDGIPVALSPCDPNLGQCGL